MLEGFTHAAGAVFLHLAIDQSLKVHIGDFTRITHCGVYRSHTHSNCAEQY